MSFASNHSPFNKKDLDDTRFFSNKESLVGRPQVVQRIFPSSFREIGLIFGNTTVRRNTHK